MSILTKFNPYDLPDETLRSVAVGREASVARIMSIIRQNATGGAIQHVQVVAPRGFGKSFLVRLVRLAAKREYDEGTPVRFILLPEEQLNVDSPHRLLNEIQRILDGKPPNTLTGATFEDDDGAWDRAVRSLDRSISIALPERKGVVVAVVENFDILLADIFRRPQDQSRLRAWLARPLGRLMLFATATRRVDGNYSQRLFHATSVIELEPWQEETCLEFYNKLRSLSATPAMSDRMRAKAQAISRFIGGSPRMATVLAEVLDNNDSLQAAETLDALIDEMTPYYKHRIETLSRQARSVLDALLRGGEPATQTELAIRLNTIQGRIARPFTELRARGEVTGAKASQSAEILYRVSDRLMAHYFRKRYLDVGSGASPLNTITEFLAAFFSIDEKRAEAERLRTLGKPSDAAVLERLVANVATSGTRLIPTWLKDIYRRVESLGDAGDQPRAIELCREAIRRAGDIRMRAYAFRHLGSTLMRCGQAETASAAFQQANALAEEATDYREQALSAALWGTAQIELDQRDAAGDMLRQSVRLAERRGDVENQALGNRLLGWVLFSISDFSGAVEVSRRAIVQAQQVLDPIEEARARRTLGFALAEVRDFEAAELELRKAIIAAENVGDVVLQIEMRRNLGSLLQSVFRHKAAKRELSTALRLAEQTSFEEEIAFCKWQLAETIGEEGSAEAAFVLYMDAINRFIKLSKYGSAASASRSMLDLADSADFPKYVVTAWKLGTEAEAAAATAVSKHIRRLDVYFGEAVEAGLKVGSFDVVWNAAAQFVPMSAEYMAWGYQRAAKTIAEASRTGDRRMAFKIIRQLVDAVANTTCKNDTVLRSSDLDHASFLRGVIATVIPQITDSELLHDWASLLQERLGTEAAIGRAFLEAAALRREHPMNVRVLERIDPDVASAVDRMLGISMPVTTGAKRRAGRGAARHKVARSIVKP
jgi:tetratricopeptide (TPR) repeat protein